MKNLWLRYKKSNFSLESKILLGVLVLMAAVTLFTATHASSDDTDNTAIFSRERFSDPLTPRTIVLITESSSGTFTFGGSTIRPTIWIPFRQPVRKPFRPPSVPGKPPSPL